MKSRISALSIAGLLIIGSEVHMHRLETASSELSALNEEIFELILAEDYDRALLAVDSLSRRMNETEMFFGSMGDHAETDNINIAIAELRSYTEEHKRPEAAARCRVLVYLFGHLPENSRLKIENIF